MCINEINVCFGRHEYLIRCPLQQARASLFLTLISKTLHSSVIAGSNLILVITEVTEQHVLYA